MTSCRDTMCLLPAFLPASDCPLKIVLIACTADALQSPSAHMYNCLNLLPISTRPATSILRTPALHRYAMISLASASSCSCVLTSSAVSEITH